MKSEFRARALCATYFFILGEMLFRPVIFLLCTFMIISGPINAPFSYVNSDCDIVG